MNIIKVAYNQGISDCLSHFGIKQAAEPIYENPYEDEPVKRVLGKSISDIDNMFSSINSMPKKKKVKAAPIIGNPYDTIDDRLQRAVGVSSQDLDNMISRVNNMKKSRGSASVVPKRPIKTSFKGKKEAAMGPVADDGFYSSAWGNAAAAAKNSGRAPSGASSYSPGDVRAPRNNLSNAGTWQDHPRQTSERASLSLSPQRGGLGGAAKSRAEYARAEKARAQSATNERLRNQEYLMHNSGIRNPGPVENFPTRNYTSYSRLAQDLNRNYGVTTSGVALQKLFGNRVITDKTQFDPAVIAGSLMGEGHAVSKGVSGLGGRAVRRPAAPLDVDSLLSGPALTSKEVNRAIAGVPSSPKAKSNRAPLASK